MEFIDHFTKYIWFYLLKRKMKVPTVFTKFKNLEENFFDSRINIVYTDGGTEYHELHNNETNLSIQHLHSLPYTLEIVGSAERCHRHIVETGLTLLHQASLGQMPSKLSPTLSIGYLPQF